MDIHRTLANGAAARQRHNRLAQPHAQRPQHQDGRAQAVQVLRLPRLAQRSGIDGDIPILPLDARAAVREHAQHVIHIGKPWRAMDGHRRGAQQRRGQDGQHRVFRRIDLRFAMQRGRMSESTVSKPILGRQTRE